MCAPANNSGWIPAVLILPISAAIAFLLIGRQVLYANWGIIDDHAVFLFLGANQHLPIGDFFHTLLAKTEVGDPSLGRFRPSYYFIMLLESVAWGKNVHLWYLARTLGFATFIASLWWLLSRFVRIWLAAALVLPILLMSFWSGVWTRLGPSEIYGAVALGLTLIGIYATMLSQHERQRKWGAALVTLAALVLIGSKETFIPLAGAAVAVLVFAGFTRRIPVWIAISFTLLIGLYAGSIVLVIQRLIAKTGEDFYANSLDLRQLLGIAAHAARAAVLGLSLVYATVMLFFLYCARRTGRDWRDWTRSSATIVVIFIFMAAVYFSQQVVYRGELPSHTRYDFPAALFVPFSCYVLLCYIFHQMRLYLQPRMTTYVAIFLTVLICAVTAPRFVRLQARALPQAVSLNIQTTNIFFKEVSALAAFAKQSPRSAIILEAYGPITYEALGSILRYVRAMGAENPISVRLHPAGSSRGVLLDRLEQQIRSWESGNDEFVPLAESLVRASRCISVGINGPADDACTGFQIRT